jgi:hypothetical protein
MVKNTRWAKKEMLIRNFGNLLNIYSEHCTVKTGVSFRHSLRHRNSASASVVSTPKFVCLSGKTTLISVKTTLLSVKTTLPLSYRVLKMTLLSAEINHTQKYQKDPQRVISNTR